MDRSLGLLYLIVFSSFLIFHSYIWVAQLYPVNSLSFLLSSGLTLLGTCMHLTSALFGYSVRRQILLSSEDSHKEAWFSKFTLGLVFIVICDGLKNIFMIDMGSFLIWGIFDCFLVALLIIQILEKFPRKVSVILLILWILLKLIIFKLGFINSDEIVIDLFHQNKVKVLLFMKTFLLFSLLGFNLIKVFSGRKTFKYIPYYLVISLFWFLYEPSILNCAVSQNYLTSITIGDTSKQNTYPLLHWFPVILGAYLLPDLIAKLSNEKYAILKIVAGLLFVGLPFFSAGLAQGADLNGFMNVALRDHYNTLFFAQMAYFIVFLHLCEKFKIDNKITQLIAYGYIFNYFVLFFVGSALARFMNQFVGEKYLFICLLLITSLISILVGKAAIRLFSKRIEINLVKSG